MQWLRDMMVRVEIKNNPLAWQDPETAIAAMAKRLVKYPPNIVCLALEEYPTLAEPIWPTEEKLVNFIQDKIDDDFRLRESKRLLANGHELDMIKADKGKYILGLLTIDTNMEPWERAQRLKTIPGGQAYLDLMKGYEGPVGQAIRKIPQRAR